VKDPGGMPGRVRETEAQPKLLVLNAFGANLRRTSDSVFRINTPRVHTVSGVFRSARRRTRSGGTPSTRPQAMLARPDSARPWSKRARSAKHCSVPAIWGWIRRNSSAVPGKPVAGRSQRHSSTPKNAQALVGNNTKSRSHSTISARNPTSGSTISQVTWFQPGSSFHTTPLRPAPTASAAIRPSWRGSMCGNVASSRVHLIDQTGRGDYARKIWPPRDESLAKSRVVLDSLEGQRM